MYLIEQFMQSVILLILLAAPSVIFSPQPYLCLLLAGLLMIVFTVRSVKEPEDCCKFGSVSSFIILLSIILAGGFAMLSGGLLSYLIFYECRLPKRQRLQIIFPSLGFTAVQLVFKKTDTAQLIYSALILAALAGVIYLAEMLAVRYLSVQNQIEKAIRLTAVNEMYEKKLNQELTMKHYLAEQNARLEERENISRNIHNSVGHSVTAAIMTLDAADLLFDAVPEKAREKMNIANERIRESLNSIRRAVRILDTQQEQVSMSDFISELNAAVESFKMDTMTSIRTDFPGPDADTALPHEYTEFLTGAVQELLSNGVRHGRAGLFVISLTADSGHIKLSVYDNGKSELSEQNLQEKIQNGFGLKKLVSFAKKCGGTVSFAKENGFKTMITLPLYREEIHE